MFLYVFWWHPLHYLKIRAPITLPYLVWWVQAFANGHATCIIRYIIAEALLTLRIYILYKTIKEFFNNRYS